FEAEDGIRDWSVTGVQTCALPISAQQRKVLHVARTDLDAVRVFFDELEGFDVDRFGDDAESGLRACFGEQLQSFFAHSLERVGRSEERRVGKGGGGGGEVGEYKEA